MTFWLGRLTEPATYWPPAQHSTGAVSFGGPQARLSRWEDGLEIIVDREGRERRATSAVTLDSDVVEDGMLLRGTSVAATPDEGARPIVKVDRIPRLRAPDEREITAYL